MARTVLFFWATLVLGPFFYGIPRAADVDLLLDFKKNVVKKDPLSVLVSWVAASRNDYCTWYGITCGKDATITWVDSISITSCQLEFVMWDGFARFQRLRYINFSDNAVSGSVPSQLGGLKTLVSLDLSFNRLVGTVPSVFNDLSSLDTLALARNNLYGTFPNGLCKSTSLRILDMSFNGLTGFTSDLRDCKKLEVLNLEHNMIDYDIGQIPFTQLKTLHVLNIGSNRLKGVLTKELSRANTITVLQLQINAITGSIPGALGLLNMLTILDLSSNQLSDIIPETIGNLALLEDLSLSQNMFSGTVPSSLGLLTGLSNRLDLSRNRFTGPVPMALGSMKWLRSIDLSDNMMSGSLPPSLGGCETLKSLNLSRNRLSGSIPPTWINMASLSVLDMSSNGLSGAIPDDLGQINSLSTLDLSRNSFTGSIPSSLAALHDLQVLDLSSNLLSGGIPNTPLFQSLGRKPFFNNSNLCGAILDIPCGGDTGTHAGVKKIDFKNLLEQSGHILNYMGLTFLAIIILFIIILIIFRLCFIEKYESVVDCLETRCSVVVGCLRCVHLTTWRPRTSLQALKVATQNFKYENIIGLGTRSTIYKGFLTESLMWQGEKWVAVKRVKGKPSEIAKVGKACRVLTQLKSQNVVRVFDWRSMGREIYIVMDFYVNGDLQNYLYNPETTMRLGMLPCLQIAFDVAHGLSYLHNEWWRDRIVHCNLNSSHILLDQNLNAYISGLRYMQSFDLKNFKFEDMEAGFIAPGESSLTKEAEVFSFGVFLLELITRKKPVTSRVALDKDLHAWVQKRFPQQGIQIADLVLLNTTYNYDNLMSFICLALSCTEQSCENRPSMNDVVATLQTLKGVEMEALPNQQYISS